MAESTSQFAMEWPRAENGMAESNEKYLLFLINRIFGKLTIYTYSTLQNYSFLDLLSYWDLNNAYTKLI